MIDDMLFKNIFIEEKRNKNINQRCTEWISTVFGPVDKILVLNIHVFS